MFNLTSIIGMVGGALLAAAVIFGLVERANYLEEKAARAADLAAAQKKVADFQAADAIKTRALEDRHAAEIAQLKDQAHDRDLSIASAASTDACAGSPAMRALFDHLRAGGLRGRQLQPGGGAADAGQPRSAAGAR